MNEMDAIAGGSGTAADRFAARLGPSEPPLKREGDLLVDLHVHLFRSTLQFHAVNSAREPMDLQRLSGQVPDSPQGRELPVGEINVPRP
jgi:hypothetical protein